MNTTTVDSDVERMLSDIDAEVQYTRQFIGKDKLDARVMAAMREVPRHEFVPKSLRSFAYDNGPLSIGKGQTISQPYIVALMTDVLNLNKNSIVLEIGTGSGYQTAVLSKLVHKVYSIEVIPELSNAASKRLQELNYPNIETRCSDGYYGWPEHAPYDGIIVTAAATEIPQPLVDQLSVNGRMIIPIGELMYGQELKLVCKDAQHHTQIQNILPVRFVPFIHKEREIP